jgi:SNF2 family DNA or RNA helicase
VADLLASIGLGDFRKYQDFRQLLKDINWTGKDPRDRLVVFCERIRTLEWLEERLTADFDLSPEMIGRVDGVSVEADEKTREVLEDFGQERSPLRILLASDMASEGLNLHFQSHRLIHFDLPWSLLRFQQSHRPLRPGPAAADLLLRWRKPSSKSTRHVGAREVGREGSGGPGRRWRPRRLPRHRRRRLTSAPEVEGGSPTFDCPRLISG